MTTFVYANSMASKTFLSTLFLLIFYFTTATITSGLFSREYLGPPVLPNCINGNSWGVDRQEAERFAEIFCNKHMAENNTKLPRVSWTPGNSRLPLSLVDYYDTVGGIRVYFGMYYALRSCDKTFELIANSTQDCTDIFGFIINGCDTSSSTKHGGTVQIECGIYQIAIDKNVTLDRDPVTQTFWNDNAGNFTCQDSYVLFSALVIMF